MRILVVEDSEVVREYLVTLLADYGQVVGAADAEEGIELFRRAKKENDPFSLIFMDILLPGMNGLQAIETIRAEEECFLGGRPCQVDIVVASALDDDVSAQRAFFTGQAASFLTKPLDTNEIHREMSRLGYQAGSASVTRTDSPLAR